MSNSRNNSTSSENENSLLNSQTTESYQTLPKTSKTDKKSTDEYIISLSNDSEDSDWVTVSPSNSNNEASSNSKVCLSDVREAAKKLLHSPAFDFLAECNKNMVMASAVATAAVEALIFFAPAAAERKCPAPNNSTEEKINMVFYENTGIFTYEVAYAGYIIGRVAVIPLAAKGCEFVADFLEFAKTNRTALSKLVSEIANLSMKRVLSAFLTFTAIQAAKEGNEYDSTLVNVASAFAIFPLTQLAVEIHELIKKRGSGSQEESLMMKIFRTLGSGGLALGAFTCITNNTFNLLNASRTENIENQGIITLYVGVAGITFGTILGIVSQCVQSQIKRINLDNMIKDILAIAPSLLTQFNVFLSVYLCWNQNLEDPNQFWGGSPIYSALFGVAGLLTIEQYFFTKLAEIKNRKAYVQLTDINGVNDDEEEADFNDLIEETTKENKQEKDNDKILLSNEDDDELYYDAMSDNECAETDNANSDNEKNLISDANNKEKATKIIQCSTSSTKLHPKTENALMNIKQLGVNLPKLTQFIVTDEKNKNFVAQRGFFSHDASDKEIEKSNQSVSNKHSTSGQ